MDSYDRLFLNKDTLPRGGFGNLIALPLQREARFQGNTLFIDENLEPYPDPWAFLAKVPRLDPRQILRLAREGELPPPLPDTLRCVLAQRLYVAAGWKPCGFG